MAKNDNEQARNSGPGVGSNLARNGGLSYLEIPAVDVRESAAFCEKVLGWKLRGHDTDDPRFEDATGHLIGRWVTGRLISREPGLLPYIYVNDIDRAVEQAEAHGGEVVKRLTRKGTCGLRPSATPPATSSASGSKVPAEPALVRGQEMFPLHHRESRRNFMRMLIAVLAPFLVGAAACRAEEHSSFAGEWKTTMVRLHSSSQAMR